MNNVLASRLSQIFGNSLSLVHNYNFPVFGTAPLGKKTGKKPGQPQHLCTFHVTAVICHELSKLKTVFLPPFSLSSLNFSFSLSIFFFSENRHTYTTGSSGKASQIKPKYGRIC